MPEEYIVWTKRLGQRHYAKAGFDSETLCGMPMLGNNYATVIPFEEQEECEECRKVMSTLAQAPKRYSVFSIDESAKGTDKRMLETFGGELEKKGWRKKK